MNNKQKKSLLSRILYGIKSGWNMPLLPDHILKIDRNLYVRLFKFGGGLCMFFIISGIGSKYNSVIFYIAIFWSMSYIIYRLTLVFYIIKQWIKDIKNGDLIVRNSPLDHISSILKSSIRTLRAVAGATVGTGFIYALCHELDDNLEKEGKIKYFIPHLKAELSKYGLDHKIILMAEKLGITDKTDINSAVDSELFNLSSEEAKFFEEQTGASISELKKVWEDIQKNKK